MPKKQTRYKHKKSKKRGGLLWPWTKKQHQAVQLLEDGPEQEQESQSQAQLSPQQETQVEPLIDKTQFLQSNAVKKNFYTGWHVNFQFYVRNKKVHVFDKFELKAYEQFKEFWQDGNPLYTEFKVRNDDKSVPVYAIVDVHISNHIYKFAALNKKNYFVRNHELLCIVDYTQYKQDSFMVNDSGNKYTQLTNAAAVHEIEGLQMRQMRPQLTQDLLFKGSTSPTKGQSTSSSSGQGNSSYDKVYSSTKAQSPTGSPTRKHVSPSSSSGQNTTGVGNQTYSDDMLSQFEQFYKNIKENPALANVKEKQIIECLEKSKDVGELSKDVGELSKYVGDFNIDDIKKNIGFMASLDVFANEIKTRQSQRFGAKQNKTQKAEIINFLKHLYGASDTKTTNTIIMEQIIEYLMLEKKIDVIDAGMTREAMMQKQTQLLRKANLNARYQSEASEKLKAELMQKVKKDNYMEQFPKRIAFNDAQQRVRIALSKIQINSRNQQEKKDIKLKNGKMIYEPKMREFYYKKYNEKYTEQYAEELKKLEIAKLELEQEDEELAKNGIVYKTEEERYNELLKEKSALPEKEKHIFTKGKGVSLKALKERKPNKPKTPEKVREYKLFDDVDFEKNFKASDLDD